MPRNRKLLGAAAFSLALAGGGVAGALLGAPTLSAAQDDGATTTEAPDAGSAPRHLGPRGDGALLDAAAEALGLTADEIRDALADGQSLADLAESQGVEAQVVVDALVVGATERLEEIEAALPERMAGLVERDGWAGRFGHPHRLHHQGEATGEET